MVDWAMRDKMGNEHAIPEDLREIHAALKRDWKSGPGRLAWEYIERIAALEAQVKPKCPDCNAVGMNHCSDPEHCGGVYWPDHMYRKLEAQVSVLSEEIRESRGYAPHKTKEPKLAGMSALASQPQPAPEEPK